MERDPSFFVEQNWIVHLSWNWILFNWHWQNVTYCYDSLNEARHWSWLLLLNISCARVSGYIKRVRCFCGRPFFLTMFLRYVVLQRKREIYKKNSSCCCCCWITLEECACRWKRTGRHCPWQWNMLAKIRLTKSCMTKNKHCKVMKKIAEIAWSLMLIIVELECLTQGE